MFTATWLFLLCSIPDGPDDGSRQCRIIALVLGIIAINLRAS